MGNLNMSAANSPVVFSVGPHITLVSLLDPNRPLRCIAAHSCFINLNVHRFCFFCYLMFDKDSVFEHVLAHLGGPYGISEDNLIMSLTWQLPCPRWLITASRWGNGDPAWTNGTPEIADAVAY